jgi:hypothetical protein
VNPPGGFEGFVAGQVAAFRERSVLLAAYGASEASQALQRAAEELESAFRAWWLAELPVSEAAAEAGYSEERMRELIREGWLEGDRARKTGPLRVRRCDLPRKPTRQQPEALKRVARRLGIA